MNKTTTGIISLAGAIALGGCVASTTPTTDAKLGEAVNLMKAQQTVNPEASLNANPVAGMDGKAAKGALDNYRDSFRKPPAEGANVLTIGISAGGSSR